jgi:VCBS repeat-containing protein
MTQITGFKAGDILDLAAVDPNFHIVTKFDGHANELVLDQIGPGNWEILGDTTGSGTANFEIHVVNATTALTAANVELASPVTAVAESAADNTLQSVTGNALAGDTGAGIYLADVGIGTASATAVSAGGSTFVGTYGTLTINPNGSYSYVETKQGLTVGQSYTDVFDMIIANANGPAAASTLDIVVSGSGVGNGGADIMLGGSGTESFSGFGANSQLTGGTGQDTFVFSSISQSTPSAQTLIRQFASNDILDLSQVDPSFKIVAKLDGHANELVLDNLGNGSWEIMGDTTGTGTANFEIHLMGVPTGYSLTAANFHL